MHATSITLESNHFSQDCNPMIKQNNHQHKPCEDCGVLITVSSKAICNKMCHPLVIMGVGVLSAHATHD